MLHRESKPAKTGIQQYFQKKDIQITFNRIFIDGMGAMAHGLFASLLIGTIIKTLGQNIPALGVLVEYGGYATSVTGAAMACAIGYALKAPPFVLFSLLAVGAAANTLGGAGGPLAVFVIALIGDFAGKLVSKTTKIDLIVTPFVTVVVGCFAAALLAPPIGKAAAAIGYAVNWGTYQQPLLMGLVVSAIVGIVLTLPISSAALCAALSLTGLAGGAALAGCCAHMVGFAVASYRENKVGGLLAQGLGTSMLQVPNLMKKPRLWIPPVTASIISGPIATVLFQLKMNGPAVAAGMGTSGMVGPIGAVTGWNAPSEPALALGEVPMQAGVKEWLGLLLVCIVIPAVISWAVTEFMRKKGYIQEGDYAIEC